MGITVLFQGAQYEKIVDGTPKSVRPFVGYSNKPGLGIIYAGDANVLVNTNGTPIYTGETGWYFNRSGTHNSLIAAYRAMLMVQAIREINLSGLGENTLGYCFHAAYWAAPERTQHAIDRGSISIGYIEEAVGGKANLDLIMRAPLPPEELDDAVNFLLDQGRPFEIEPLMRELSQGNLARTPALERLATVYARQQEAMQFVRTGLPSHSPSPP